MIRHLYGRPLETLLATWGISLILQQAVRTTFGANNKEVGAPAFMAGSFHLGGLEIAVLVFIILFIQKRPRGLFALKGRSVEA